MDMDSSARGRSTRAASPAQQPWLPVPPVVVANNDNHHHHIRQDLYFDDPAAGLIVTAVPSPTKLSQPPPASRRAGKRRPRPPPTTTYISADRASFRRMVHQATGAVAGQLHQRQPNNNAPPALTPPVPETALCRPAPFRRALPPTMLPTLDTSAFLLGDRGGSRAPAQLEAGAGVVGPGGRGATCACSDGGGRGFPTLESWDALLDL